MAVSLRSVRSEIYSSATSNDSPRTPQPSVRLRSARGCDFFAGSYKHSAPNGANLSADGLTFDLLRCRRCFDRGSQRFDR